MNLPSASDETRPAPPPLRSVPQSSLWLKVVSALSFMGLIFLLYHLFAQVVQSFSVFSYIIFAVSLLLLDYLVTAAHEIGHVVAGKLVGFRFRYLMIGPLKIEHNNSRLTLKRVSTRSMPSGLASAMPTDDNALHRRMIIMIAGGSLANLLVALLAAIAFLSLLGRQLTLIALIFLSLCLLSTMKLVLNLLATLTPFLPGGFPSDGRLILELLRKSPQAERMCASIAILNASRSGIRPRDWNAALVQQATRPPDYTLSYLSGLSIAYYRALDRNEIDEASRWLNQIVEGLPRVPPAFRANFLLEVAYFEAVYRGNAISARAYLSEAKEGVQIDQAVRSRVEAAVLLAEGQLEAARATAMQGLSLLDQISDLGSRQSERDWLQDITDRAQRVQSDSEASFMRADQ